jgi:hypothetical protein
MASHNFVNASFQPLELCAFPMFKMGIIIFYGICAIHESSNGRPFFNCKRMWSCQARFKF